MNRRRIFLMIMLESVFLSVVGGFTGMAVSGIVIGITNHTGINLVKYSEDWKPSDTRPIFTRQSELTFS